MYLDPPNQLIKSNIYDESTSGCADIDIFVPCAGNYKANFVSSDKNISSYSYNFFVLENKNCSSFLVSTNTNTVNLNDMVYIYVTADQIDIGGMINFNEIFVNDTLTSPLIYNISGSIDDGSLTINLEYDSLGTKILIISVRYTNDTNQGYIQRPIILEIAEPLLYLHTIPDQTVPFI